MKSAVFKHSQRLALFAWIIGVQLISSWFAGEAVAMSMRRAPFHGGRPIPFASEHAVWRTLAGYPGKAGTNDGPAVAARFSGPAGVAVDASGTIYVADSGNHVIRKISPAGLVSTLAGRAGTAGWQDGPATNALLRDPHGLVLDADGNLYVCDSGNHVIREISAAGIVTTIAGRPGISGYGDGNGMNAMFQFPICLAHDANGNLYVADRGNYVIRKINSAGDVSTLAGLAGTSGYQDGAGTNALFGNPQGLALDSKGDLCVADGRSANAIRKISPAGVVSTWVGQLGKEGYRDGHGTNAWFAFPFGLVPDGQGNLYVTEYWNRCVRKITPGGEVSTIGGDAWAGADVPWGDPSQPNHSDGLGAFARFDSPVAVALHPSGHLVVVDSGNHTIRYGSVGAELRPQIINQPRSQAAQEGANVTLSVSALCAASLTYQWLAKGQIIAGATNPSLVLKNVARADAGEYRVAVSVGAAYVLSFPAALKVLSATSSSPDPLANWHPVASLSLQDVHGLAYGNGRYVAIGGGYAGGGANELRGTPPEMKGAVATSTDGEHWVKQFPVTPGTLYSVAFGDGKFIAVGTRAKVLTSTDGLAWQAQVLTPEGTPDLHGIAFDQGMFVAVSGDANGSIWTSTDGSNWTNRGVDFGVSFTTVAAARGKFIAAGNTIMVSTNGIDWEAADVPTNYLGQEIALEHVAFANGTYLAAVHENSGPTAASTDGWSWRDATPASGLSLSRVTFGNEEFVAVDWTSGGVTLSKDGVAWSTPVLISSGAPSCTWPHLHFDHGLFVATGDKGALFTSVDGKAWNYREQQGAMPFAPKAILQAQGRYFAVGHGDLPWIATPSVSWIETSANGSDWSLLPAQNGFPFSGIAFGGGMLVAVGGEDEVFTSPDGGATWTDRSPHLVYPNASSHYLSRVVFGGGVFVASGSLATSYPYIWRAHLLISNDGVSWTPVDFAPTNSLSEVAYGAGLFVALLNQSSGNNEILTSTNGLSWQTTATISNNQLNALAYGNGRFVVATSTGAIITSPDGKTWSQHTLPDVNSFSRIVFGNGFFLANASSTLWSSPDGVTWTQCAAPPVSYFQSLAAGDGVFFAVGEDDAVLYQSGPIERLGNPRWLSNTNLEWTVTGAPRINYRIEFSEDLLNWQTLEHVTNAPATRPFTDPAAATRTNRLYRVVTE